LSSEEQPLEQQPILMGTTKLMLTQVMC